MLCPVAGLCSYFHATGSASVAFLWVDPVTFGCRGFGGQTWYWKFGVLLICLGPGTLVWLWVVFLRQSPLHHIICGNFLFPGKNPLFLTQGISLESMH